MGKNFGCAFGAGFFIFPVSNFYSDMTSGLIYLDGRKINPLCLVNFIITGPKFTIFHVCGVCVYFSYFSTYFCIDFLKVPKKNVALNSFSLSQQTTIFRKSNNEIITLNEKQMRKKFWGTAKPKMTRYIAEIISKC